MAKKRPSVDELSKAVRDLQRRVGSLEAQLSASTMPLLSERSTELAERLVQAAEALAFPPRVPPQEEDLQPGGWPPLMQRAVIALQGIDRKLPPRPFGFCDFPEMFGPYRTEDLAPYFVETKKWAKATPAETSALGGKTDKAAPEAATLRDRRLENIRKVLRQVPGASRLPGRDGWMLPGWMLEQYHIPRPLPQQ